MRDWFLLSAVGSASEKVSSGHGQCRVGVWWSIYRSASPENGFLILNRLGLNDLTEPLNKNLEFQLQDPFLLYRNGTGELALAAGSVPALPEWCW